MLAIVSLAALVALLAVVIVTLLRTPLFLVGVLAGIAVATAGGWWAITERGWRRWVGVAVLIGAIGLIVATWFAAVARNADNTRLLLVGLALFALTVGAARAAMVRDLHEIDRQRQRSWRPEHPVLICNPKSGGGKVEKFDLIGMAEELGVETVILTENSDLAQLARDAIAAGADCLGMAGGDGSQALVASIAIEHALPFVVISAGTRNHFALDLGLNREDPRAGMLAFTEGVLRDVDYATVGDRLFVNNVSLGVYAAIVEEEGYREAKVETSLARLPEMLGSDSEPFDLQFTSPDGTAVDGALLVLVSNNPYVLGPALDVSQRRALDTGELGVVAVTAKSSTDAAALVTRVTFGRGQADPNLFEFTCKEFAVHSRSGDTWAGIDGESVQLPTPLQFAIHPKGMRLLVPPETILEAERRRARSVRVSALVELALGRDPHGSQASGS